MNRYHSLTTVVVLIFVSGLILSASNYQFQIEVVPAGTWEEVRPIQLSADITNYVDSTTSTTYGTITSGPPSGMGADSSAYTTLTEAGYESVGSYSAIDSELFGSSPTGWTLTYWSIYINQALSDSTSSTRTMTSESWDLSSYDRARANFDWGSYSTGAALVDADDYYFQHNEGGWTTWLATPDFADTDYIDIGYIYVDTSSSTFQVRWISNTATSDERLKVDAFNLYAAVVSTYYRFEAVFQFDSVTTGLNYSLIVYFDTALSGSDDLDFYIGATSNPTQLVADNKQDSFSVDVTSYIGSTTYLKIADDYRTGDTASTDTKISRCYLWHDNNIPAVDAMSLTNPDDTDNLYAQYTEYVVTMNVSDDDGYSDISYAQLSIWDGVSSPDLWVLRYTEDTDTFSEFDTGNMIEPTANCEAVRSGTTIDITFCFYIEWAHTDLSDYDFKGYVIDADGESSTLYQASGNYDFETRLDISGLGISDGSGVTTRGDVNGAITISGTLIYFGSSLYPLSTEVDVWASCTDVTTSPWNDTILVSGVFSISAYADDIVGNDTYSIKVVIESAGSGGTDQCHTTHSSTYVADRVNFTCTTSENWATVGTSITAMNYATYEYDGLPYTGSVTWIDSTNGTVTKHVVGNYSFRVVSFTDTTYGITALTNVSAYCIWDDIEISTVAYFWVQYSPTAVWLVWGIATTYLWSFNSSVVQDGIKIQAQMNGTDNAWAITDGGSIAGFVIGSFNPSWYYVNISIRAQTGVYDWIIWTRIIEVDILHSIHIEDSGIDVQDEWITFIVHTNWGNASFTIWDNDTLVGHSGYEGWYQIAKPTTIGLHNYTILVNGTHGSSSTTGQTKNFILSNSWIWRNFKFVVNPVALSIEEVMVLQNNVTVVLTARVFTPILSLSYYVYEAGVLIDTSSFSITESGSYFSIWWEKSSVISTANWSLIISTGSSNVTIHGFNVIIDSAEYITTNNAAIYEDNRIIETGNKTIVEGDLYSGEDPRTAMWETLNMIIYYIALPSIAAMMYFIGVARQKRRRVQPDLSRGTDTLRELSGSRRRQ